MMGITSAIGAAAAVTGFVGYLHIQSLGTTIETLKAEKLTLAGKVASCEARATNIMEDKASDATIDNLSDLNTVPDHWMRGSDRSTR